MILKLGTKYVLNKTLLILLLLLAVLATPGESLAQESLPPGPVYIVKEGDTLSSIARSFGYHYGTQKKVRINTISQSPTVTTAGSGVKGFDEFIAYSEAMSPLGNATGQACADYCATLFSDLTRYVTMQNLFHDGGFSNTGVSMEVISKFATENEG